jgi:F0F1-type ATP synthase assembly protein I
MAAAATSSRPPTLATASGLLLGTITVAMGVGVLLGWALGGAGLGLLIGAIVGIPAAVTLVYRVYGARR